SSPRPDMAAVWRQPEHLQPEPHPKEPRLDSFSPTLIYAIQSPNQRHPPWWFNPHTQCRSLSLFSSYLLVRGGLLACAGCTWGCCVVCGSGVVCGTWPPFILFSSLRFFSLRARISSLSFFSVVSASSTIFCSRSSFSSRTSIISFGQL